jgi:hypothetical protein
MTAATLSSKGAATESVIEHAATTQIAALAEIGRG